MSRKGIPKDVKEFFSILLELVELLLVNFLSHADKQSSFLGRNHVSYTTLLSLVVNGIDCILPVVDVFPRLAYIRMVVFQFVSVLAYALSSWLVSFQKGRILVHEALDLGIHIILL